MVLGKSKIKIEESKPTTKGNNVIQNKLYGRQIHQYKLNNHGIPFLIHNLIIKLYSKGSFLQAEGIMRKSCNIE